MYLAAILSVEEILDYLYFLVSTRTHLLWKYNESRDLQYSVERNSSDSTYTFTQIPPSSNICYTSNKKAVSYYKLFSSRRYCVMTLTTRGLPTLPNNPRHPLKEKPKQIHIRSPLSKSHLIIDNPHSGPFSPQR